MIKSIDHIVLTTRNIEQIIHFYCDILGMKLERFSPSDGSPERLALHFGNQKINLHDANSPFKPHAKNPTSGSIDLCFLSNISIQDWVKAFEENKIQIETGPARKTGATGLLLSVYVRDPDGNLIEISNLI